MEIYARHNPPQGFSLLYTDKHPSDSQLSFTICLCWSSPTLPLHCCLHFPPFLFCFFSPLFAQPNTIFLSVFNCSVFSEIASLGPSLLWYELFVSVYCAAVVPGSRLPYDTVSLTQCWRRVWITLIIPIFAGIDLYVDLFAHRSNAQPYSSLWVAQAST